MEPILAVRDLTYRREGFTLTLERLDLLPGRMYLLAGPNGAGKSTLLQILALLLAPERGEIRFAGQPVQGAAQRQRLRRQVTLVEQAPYLFNTTVYRNLSFGLGLREVSGDLQRRRIAEALEKVGLQGFESRRAQALSGGETRRVAIARAMALKPKVLLLDEPTAGLDREAIPLIETSLAALPGEGVTVLISTHDAGQHHRLGGELLRLEAGRLVNPTSGLRAESVGSGAEARRCG